MKFTFSRSLKSYGFFCRLFIFAMCGIFIFSCSSNPPAESSTLKLKTDENWVDLQIKYKPEATAEIRDASLKAIEQILTDTLREMRKNGYSGFLPDIFIKKSPFKDTNSVEILVRNGKGIIATAQDTVPPPPCICPQKCRLCAMATLLAVRFPGPPFEITVMDPADLKQVIYCNRKKS